MGYKQGQIVSPYDLFHTLDNSCQVLSHLSHFSFDIIRNSVEIERDVSALEDGSSITTMRRTILGLA